MKTGRIIFALAVFCVSARAAEHPFVAVSNGVVSVRSYLPGETNSCYRSVRFVRCSMTDEVAVGQNRFYGRLFPGAHKPDGNAYARGLAEEFDIASPPGFAEAEPGGAFLKIGVGALVKPDDKPYDFNRTYPLADAGVWRTETLGTTGVVYRHAAKTPDGMFGAEYTHTLVLGENFGTLTLRRSLKNTGTKTLRTQHYAHHFMSVDNAPVAESYSVRYDFAPVATTAVPPEMQIDGNRVRFTKPPRGWIRLGVGGFENAPNRVTLWQREHCAGIEVRTDRPIADACIFATPTAVCPELFVDLEIASGETEAWQTDITFLLPR